jgi:hypothetical protein
MRKALTLAIGMLFATSGAAFSAEKTVNTICPNCGNKTQGQTCIIVLKDKSGKNVTVGTANNACTDVIFNDPNPQKYIDAAKANKKAQ